MLFYEYGVQIVMENFQDDEQAQKQRVKRLDKVLVDKRNRKQLLLGAVCDIVSFENEGLQGYKLDLVLVLDHLQAQFEKLEEFLAKAIEECFGSSQITFNKEEITLNTAHNHLDCRSMAARELRHLVKNGNEIITWEEGEYLLKKVKLSKKAALDRAKQLMLDASVLEELERIYSAKNSKKFLGHPVHYIIKANSKRAAGRIIKLLLEALYNNHRLVSSRFSLLAEMTPNWDQDSMNYFYSQGGAAVVVETKGSEDSFTSYASAYEEVVEGFDKAFCRYGNQVLFIGVELSRSPGFGKVLQQTLEQHGQFVVLQEGCGDQKQARAVFRQLVEKHNLLDQLKRVPLELPEDKDCYNLSEVYDLFEEWKQRAICAAYGAYSLKSKVKKQVVEESRGLGYKKLQKLVGLKHIKELVDQLLAVNRLNRQRSRMNLGTLSTSRHMLFTGNPGSAKTTVARLLTKVMFEEQLLDNNLIVECGRGDLVGKYVGWTAKQVQKKFREARGGILFIDEAYSLVDDSGSFGDEAINTIVQEMENNRDNVIVIFAGYPDKMKSFLDKNEGLRSRIAFHLDFPDYTAEELLQILELQAEEKGFCLDEAAKAEATAIFQQAVKHKDYGNGRFVRNLLEKAFLKQALRLAEADKDKVLAVEELNQLTGTDFKVEALKGLKDDKAKTMGFGVE